MNDKQNVFRLTIVNILYSSQLAPDGIVTCTIKYRNPITNTIQQVKASARAGVEPFDYKKGKRIAEARAKTAMYKRYAKFVSRILTDVRNKHLELAAKEVDHANELINEVNYTNEELDDMQ